MLKRNKFEKPFERTFAVRRLPPPTASKLQTSKDDNEYATSRRLLSKTPDLAEYGAFAERCEDFLIVLTADHLQHALAHNVHVLADFALTRLGHSGASMHVLSVFPYLLTHEISGQKQHRPKLEHKIADQRTLAVLERSWLLIATSPSTSATPRQERRRA